MYGATRLVPRALVAYVHYGHHEIVRSDSEFVQAVKLLPRAERCVWTDLSVLLGPGSGAHNQHTLLGEQRDALNDRIWWLSTPLYTGSPANERTCRALCARSRDAAALDRFAGRAVGLARAQWRAGNQGDDAHYGRPAYLYWLGHDEDSTHFAYLDGRRLRASWSAGPLYDRGVSARSVPHSACVVRGRRSRPIRHGERLVGGLDAATAQPGIRRHELVAAGAHAPCRRAARCNSPTNRTGVFRRETRTSRWWLPQRISDAGAIGRAIGDTVLGTLIITPAPGRFRMLRQPSVKKDRPSFGAQISRKSPT